MGARYASGRKAIAECDVCGFRTKLTKLRKLVINSHLTNIMACNVCFDQDHPQYQLGKFPIDDPQAVRDPRPDTSYYQSGLTSDGSIGEGSRVINWGWGPVGFNNPLGLSGLVDTLICRGTVGTVTVETE